MTQARILRLSGPDTRDFLQGLVTNDIAKLSDGLVYAAMLTPQGKYLADFFLSADGDDVLLDVAEELADMLVQRLSMYKLRAKVEITPTELHLHRGLGTPPPDGWADPRHPALGWRAYRETPQQDDDTDWTALRVTHVIPETGVERLNGVDFRKGCYVGQEVTARMKHKTDLRKGLTQVDLSGTAPVGSAITAAGKPAGTLLSQTEGKALAYLRFDRAAEEMEAEGATVRWQQPQ